MSDIVTLTRNQRRALAALLTAKTITDAAAACGLTEKTLYRYMDRAEFRQALTQAERDLVDNATRRLMVGQNDALDVLQDVMKSLKDTDKRQAAQAWLDYSLKYKNIMDYEARLCALEKAVFYGKN
jgi:hypothetical protein